MDLQTFTALVSGSPLIPAELKTKLLTKAEGHTPEHRAEIAAKIRKAEEDFLAATKAKQAEIATAKATADAAKLTILREKEARQCETEKQILAALEAAITAI